MGMVTKLVLAACLLSSGSVQQPEIHKTRIPQPPKAAEAWNYILSCTKLIGLEPSPGGNLADVKWYVAELPHTRQAFIIGAYFWPDTLVLDTRALDQTAIIAHELLHHLMYVDPRDGEPSESHPYVPFYHPCKLMASQTMTFDTLTGVLTFKATGLVLKPRTP